MRKVKRRNIELVKAAATKKPEKPIKYAEVTLSNGEKVVAYAIGGKKTKALVARKVRR